MAIPWATALATALATHITGARMVKRERSARARTFVFRGGTRIAGTVIACDATGGGDLLFVSSARAWVREAAAGAREPGRAQILTTAETLALMGPEGDRLPARALVVGVGRPFVLGSLRLELLPSGHLPGAAALVVDTGDRRILYAGAARLGTPAWGAVPGAIRAADALCIDATFGDPRFAFVSHEEAAGAALRFVRAARASGCAPVLLAAPYGPAHDLAPVLAADGWKLRGHRSIVAAVAAYRRAGFEPPAISRFSGSVGTDEVLLWPAEDRDARRLGGIGPSRVAWVSGLAADATAVARVGVDEAIPYSRHADFAGLLSYVMATGAREVATKNGFAEDFAAALRERDIDAYVLGAPRQIALFAEPD